MSLTALRVRGPFRGPSGYDHHVREFVREFHRQGIAVQLLDVSDWGPTFLPDDKRDSWFDSLSEPVNADVTLHFCMPHQVVPRRSTIDVNYTMFEATRICRPWVECSRHHDLIILPTESSRRAWIAGGVGDEKLRLCPMGINTRLFNGTAPEYPLTLGDGDHVATRRVRFLNVSEVGTRKNHVGLISAWLQATNPGDDAVLILKVGFYSPGGREMFFHGLEVIHRQLGKRPGDAAPILIVDQLFGDEDMPRLYAAATHYISMSFGEGWDQTMVEAGASGLRLIAPDHSAYTDYLDSSNARLIPSREVPALLFEGGVTQELFSGSGWWAPDERDAVDAIRSAIDGRDAVREPLRDRLVREFSWQRSTERLISILDEMSPRAKRPSFWLVPPWSRQS